MSDCETALLLEESTDKIFSRVCTTALLREVDLTGVEDIHARDRASGASGAVDVAGRNHEASPQRLAQAREALGPLVSELSAAGLELAMAPEACGGAALGWRDVRGMIEAAGRHCAPVPLAEACAAQALARLAGVALPEGRAVIGVARALGASVAVDGIAHAAQSRWVACTLECAEAGNRLLVFDTVKGTGRHGVSISGEERAHLTWALADAALNAPAPQGCDSLLAGAAIRSAQIAGACARVVSLAAQYANDRQQFGRPIAKFQAIQQQLALAGEWSAMASMASRLALSDEGVGLDIARVASAKQVAGTAVEHCASIAHAVHGAIGVTLEYDLQLFTRRLWTWAGDFGSSQYWAGLVGRILLDARDERVWDEVIRISTP